MRRRTTPKTTKDGASSDDGRKSPLPNKQEDIVQVRDNPGVAPIKRLPSTHESSLVEKVHEDDIPAEATATHFGSETLAAIHLNRIRTLPPEIRLMIYPHLCSPDISTITICESAIIPSPRVSKDEIYTIIYTQKIDKSAIRTRLCNAWVRVEDAPPGFQSRFHLSIDDRKPITEQDLQKLLLDSEPELCRAHPELRDELLPSWFKTYRPAVHVSRLDQHSLMVLKASVQYLIDNAWAGAQLFGITFCTDSDLTKVPSLGPLFVRLVKLLRRYQARVTMPNAKSSHKSLTVNVSKEDRVMRKERDLFESILALASPNVSKEVMDDLDIEAQVREMFSRRKIAVDWSEPSVPGIAA